MRILYLSVCQRMIFMQDIEGYLKVCNVDIQVLPVPKFYDRDVKKLKVQI